MKAIAFLTLSALALMTTLPALAAKGSWDDVKQVNRGLVLVVRAQTRIDCILVDVSDQDMTCDVAESRSLWRRSLANRVVLKRNTVREVRFTQDRETTATLGMFKGAGIGALTGLVVAVSPNNSGEDAVAAPILLGLIGGGIGLVVGAHTPLASGPLVYKR